MRGRKGGERGGREKKGRVTEEVEELYVAGLFHVNKSNNSGCKCFR